MDAGTEATEDVEALRTEIMELRLALEASEEREALLQKRYNSMEEELQHANKRLKQIDMALRANPDRSEHAFTPKECSGPNQLIQSEDYHRSIPTPKSASPIMDLVTLAKLGDDPKTAAGRKRASQATVIRSLKKIPVNDETPTKSQQSVRQHKHLIQRTPKTLKRSMSAVSSSMALKQAEIDAAVAVLQTRTGAAAKKPTSKKNRPTSKKNRHQGIDSKPSPKLTRMAWRGGGMPENKKRDKVYSRKGRIEDALLKTEAAAKKSLKRSLRARSRKLALESEKKQEESQTEKKGGSSRRKWRRTRKSQASTPKGSATAEIDSKGIVASHSGKAGPNIHFGKGDVSTSYHDSISRGDAVDGEAEDSDESSLLDTDRYVEDENDSKDDEVSVVDIVLEDTDSEGGDSATSNILHANVEREARLRENSVSLEFPGVNLEIDRIAEEASKIRRRRAEVELPIENEHGFV